ncbi:FAD-binding oxidoreductase [Tunicatimonas pelagia]|uniref:FAD-binding oxidoreductase n=1 Tax=Tunicatimonas pelagia TaxID=931531 RepID=UPI0026655AE3|nr:FAD-binding oxidoreductase [Tunicatimonas pelagia]WKN43501.1 FAD-binding oxidoreductase [Tunicatimonas pelagia]
MKTTVSNWSNYPVKDTTLTHWRGESIPADRKNWIARGLGRCYGDAALSDQILSTVKHNHILEFNPESGVICCQSGVSLHNLLEVFVPKGWFLPVTPGTKFITVGGALASDIHGKNHHIAGCFGDHVSSCTLLLADGKRIRCSPTENSEVFNATRGGMGLTGMIDTVTFQLKKIESSYIKQRQIKAQNLNEVLALFDKYKSYTYSMAWIDCLKGGKNFGRSIMMMGEHATLDELTSKQQQTPLISKVGHDINMPINLPGFVLNSLSVKAFNWLYFHKNVKKVIENTVHYDPFFYPLDSILHWNRMYGKKGFVQYQFVLPISNSKEGLVKIMDRIRQKGWGSFLSVLKLFGKQESLISFPMEGYTLALDFPLKKGLFNFLDELDELVLDLGGRIYLTKDARMKADTFMNSYPGSREFLQILKQINPDLTVQSDLAKRLSILPS